ncbi:MULTISPECIES: M14 family zinc carboxypeptidase [unclassified Bacillus (in: firmicutes)]|uniref:M14 family zinc carboxypeptidase n=1 Tax=unclassified Bacillus (in: firmicutes) TaxID=185979 RepID=UPI0008E35AF0|nr:MULTISPECIES: M14 family zinc carboxypeptidase [unclassified Bacillus (in: firmicutes)]SFB21843.1 Glucan-binding domain-containing protein (YG repeat) [Bacillus sp. UNCCL13]SFQ91039.1 Glucan-binding domain-containing protein (YG repeat) [Bacillus sp. cl95]
MKKLAVSVLLCNSLLYPLNAFAEGTSSTAETNQGNVTSQPQQQVTQSTNEGWVKEGEFWYYYINNEKAKGWQEIESKWYFFDEETGARQNGWLEDEGSSYYLDPETGAMVTGWLNVENKWYYLDIETGKKQFGHVQIEGKWYYLNETTGVRLQNGWTQFDSKWYYFNPQTGERHAGWLQEGTKWYYLLPETGIMQTKWANIEGKWYYFDAKTGVRKTGWLQDGTKWYYLNNDGSMRTGWVYSKYKWYYLADTGALQTGWVKDQGKWYFLDPAADGAMDTGWLKWNNKWYFLNKDGTMKIGWHWEDNKWYYLQSSGVMATGWYQVDSKWYYSYKNGVLAQDTYVDGFYLGRSGVWIPDIVNPRKVYTYEEMVSDIGLFQKYYPDLVKVQIIGKSVDGRNIYAFKLGKGEKEIFLNGSHHAREHMTTNLLMEMADQYIHSYTNGTTLSGYSVKNLLNKTSMWFVPMVNPDGVTLVQKGAYSAQNPSYLLMLNKNSHDFSEWKANIRGVDLNRQYPADWATISGNTGKPAPSNFKGTKPLSEPEALAVYNFTKAHNFKIATAYHSSGEILYWYFKQGSGTYNRDYNIAMKYKNMTGYSLVKPTTNPSGGGYTDWFIQDMKMPGFTPEISPFTYGKPVPVSYFDSIWNENKAAGLMLANEALGL